MNYPNDISAERLVLSGMAKFGESALYDIDDILDAQCFHDLKNQTFYTILKHGLSKFKVLDETTFLAVANELNLYDTINNTSDLEYIRVLFNSNIKLENIRRWAGKLKKLYIARQLQDRLKEAHEELSTIDGSESVDHILQTAETPVFNMSVSLSKDSSEKPFKLFSEVNAHLEHLEENRSEIVGISTGFPIYDAVIGGGLRRGSVNIVAARPKVGKTTFCKDVALHIAGKLNVPVLVLDTEMNHADQMHRALASISNVDTRLIENGMFSKTPNRHKVYKEAARIKEIPFYYKSIPGKPFEEILSVIRRWTMQEVGLDENGNTNDCVLIYDYFKLMDVSALKQMQEYQALGFQLSELVNLCNQYQIACLGFVQENREFEVSQSDRLVWFGGSISHLQRKTDADLAEDGPNNGNRKLIPTECRYGPEFGLGNYINFQLHGAVSRFEELNTRDDVTKQRNNPSGFDTENSEDTTEHPPWDE